MPTELTRVYLPFAEVVKSTLKGADGKDIDIRLVKGLMTDESKDLDGQIVDHEWAKGAALKWHSAWGNVREQHSHNAIGKSVELSVLEPQRAHQLTSKVVDPLSIIKLDEQILQGYSVGIRGARIVKDAKAPNGRIVGGEIIEVSLVDHPANENCKVALVKAAKSGELEDVEQSVIEKVAETETAKDSILDDLAADIDGLNEDDTVPPGKQTPAEPGSGTGTQLDVMPESALARRKKKRQPEATPKAGEPDTEKGVTTQVQPDGTVTVWAADAEPVATQAVESAVTAAASDLGGSLTAIEPTGDKTIKPQTTKSEEDIEMLFAKAFTEVKDLLTKGDSTAALALIQATEVLSKSAVVKPVATEPVVETPAVEPSVTTDKAASPDTLKAAISEAVTKAVETAVKSLQEKVEAMEKRAAPGGPLLSGTRMLSAPEAIKGQFAKDRIEDIQKMADDHPDGAMRQGARELLAEIAKNA